MSRVLMTGGSGFIGGAMVRQLRARGDNVTAIVRDLGRAQPSRKATDELGFSPRDLETGLRDWLIGDSA